MTMQEFKDHVRYRLESFGDDCADSDYFDLVDSFSAFLTNNPPRDRG